MKTEKISARIKSGDAAGREGTVELELPETTQEAVEKYGEDVVFSRFRAALIIDAQSYMRSQLGKESEPSAEELQTALEEWKPGVRPAGKSTTEKASDLIAKLTAEERDELFAKYMEEQQANSGGSNRGRRR